MTTDGPKGSIHFLEVVGIGARVVKTSRGEVMARHGDIIVTLPNEAKMVIAREDAQFLDMDVFEPEDLNESIAQRLDRTSPTFGPGSDVPLGIGGQPMEEDPSLVNLAPAKFESGLDPFAKAAKKMDTERSGAGLP